MQDFEKDALVAATTGEIPDCVRAALTHRVNNQMMVILGRLYLCGEATTLEHCQAMAKESKRAAQTLLESLKPFMLPVIPEQKGPQ